MPSRLATVYRAEVATLRRLASLAAFEAWQGLGSWDDRDVARYIEQVGPVVQAAQMQAVVLTDAYLAGILGESPRGLDPTPALTARGTPIEETYRRPFVQTWKALADGVAFEAALTQGAARARQTADTDVQLAARQSSHDWMSTEPRITGYRRVLGPGRNCDLCQVAATNRYSRDDLMPIHSGCGCTVEPIIDGRDPGGTRPKARELPEVAVVEHGELGPVLWNAAHEFTSL